jgi:hypothetical protein
MELNSILHALVAGRLHGLLVTIMKRKIPAVQCSHSVHAVRSCILNDWLGKQELQFNMYAVVTHTT